MKMRTVAASRTHSRALYDAWSTIAVLPFAEPRLSVLVWEGCQDVDLGSVTALIDQAGRPVLPIWTRPDHVWIGPWMGAGFDHNCIGCVAGRRLRHRTTGTDEQRADLRTPTWVRLAACAIAADEVTGYERRRTNLGCSTIEIDATTLAMTIRPAFRDRGCPRCSGSKPGGRKAALRAILAQHTDGREPAGPTGVPVDPIETIVDARTGLVDAIGELEGSPVPTVVTTLRTTSGPDTWGPILTAGRSESPADARRKALYEALERYCAAWPRPDRVFTASYKEIDRLAVHPSELVLHTAEQYERPGFPYQPFLDDDVLEWTWSWDAVNDEWRAVPSQSVYYGVEASDAEPTFALETSNGWALGRSVVDAAVRGLLEVIERHAYLMSWYTQHVRGSIPREAVADPRVAWLRRRLAVRGYELRLLDIRSRGGVPAVWALALGTPSEGATVAAVSGLAADPSPDNAVWRATLEAATSVVDAERRLRVAGERVPGLAQDHRTVTSMSDHLLLYTDYGMRKHLAFALDAGPSESWPAAGSPAGEGLEAGFGSLLATLEHEGVDGRTRAFVTDTTAPEARVRGLHSVRVTVPGLLPMTFGYDMERLAGAAALETVLGGRDHNRVPHAFS
jgi:ribosomal protein S12 methylthiotransferase accessory factor